MISRPVNDRRLGRNGFVQMSSQRRGPAATLINVGISRTVGASVLALLAVGGCGSRSQLSTDEFASNEPGTCRSSVGSATKRIGKTPLDMEIVLDGSGSMSDDNKWVAVSAGLDVIFDDLLAEPDRDLAVGLIIFSDQKDRTVGEGPYPTAVDVPLGIVDAARHDALRKRLDTTYPGAGTPTLRALRGGFNTLTKFTSPETRGPNGRKIVVLMTDGVPSGPPNVPFSHQIEQGQCIDLVRAQIQDGPPTGPIRTFAVGIGPFPGNSDYDPNFIGDLAIAGGTRASPQCEPHTATESNVCHFQVSPLGKSSNELEREFVAAIEKIRQISVQGCEFSFDTESAPSVDVSKIKVVYTDAAGGNHTIAQDTDNGWTFDPSTRRVFLHGQACTSSNVDLRGSVSVVLGC